MRIRFHGKSIRMTAILGLIVFAGVLSASAQTVESFHYTAGAKVDGAGRPRAMFGLTARVGNGNAETSARAFLQRHASTLGLNDAASTLTAQSTITVPGGSHVRFAQRVNGIPVYGSDVVVSLNTRNEVTMLVNNSLANVQAPADAAVDQGRALRLAREHLKTGSVAVGNPDAAALMIYPTSDGSTHLVYRVTLTREDPAGDWEVFVDAESGSILRTRDMFVEYREGERIQGQGYVYLSDPLAAARQVYGAPGFVDNNDSDSDSLTAYRSLVTLDSLTFTDGAFQLVGPYCTITDIEAPVDSLYTSATPDGFQYTRSQAGFEAVNAYYHATESYKRLQELGFSSAHLAGLRIDPHGFQGADNSHYSPSGNWISFGTGGVDDAEDADVIWHECAHAIQYAFVPSWGDGEMAALGEGYSDYWASSHSRSTNGWTRGDTQYDWVFRWDGHNEFWSGRRVNDSRTYPFSSLSVHSAGQIWSSALMSVWNELGRDVTDRIVIKSLFYLGAGATATDAAIAVLQADKDLYNGQHLATLIYWLGTIKRFVDPSIINELSTDVADLSTTPATFALDQNYPNPFNPTTTLRFSLAEGSTVRLRIFNVIGQEVGTLAEGQYPAGAHTIAWDATNAAGAAVGTSVYMARLDITPASGGQTMTFVRKMVLLR
jgi:Zn-dependent metalloprotease